MTNPASVLRKDLRARLEDEALADPRVRTLERWIERLPDDEVADAIELFVIGLNTSRRYRWIVLRIIDDELRQRDELLPHSDRVAFLRWIVRARETDAKIQAKLREIREAPPHLRGRIIDALSAGEGASTSLENAHPVLASAWRATPPSARPLGPVHRGEPEPVIGTKETVRLVMFFARRLAHLVPRSEKKAFDRLLELATTALAAGRPSVPLDEAIEGASREGALSLARSACIEARVSLPRPSMTGLAARPAAAKAVNVLLEAEGEEAVRAFLADTDEEIRRLDVVHALEGRKRSASRPIVRALYRGVEDGTVVLWLAELEGGRLGLLSKQGRLWEWTEGSREEVLATVPDGHFEHAVMAGRRT